MTLYSLFTSFSFKVSLLAGPERIKDQSMRSKQLGIKNCLLRVLTDLHVSLSKNVVNILQSVFAGIPYMHIGQTGYSAL